MKSNQNWDESRAPDIELKRNKIVLFSNIKCRTNGETAKRMSGWADGRMGGCKATCKRNPISKRRSKSTWALDNGFLNPAAVTIADAANVNVNDNDNDNVSGNASVNSDRERVVAQSTDQRPETRAQSPDPTDKVNPLTLLLFLSTYLPHLPLAMPLVVALKVAVKFNAAAAATAMTEASALASWQRKQRKKDMRRREWRRQRHAQLLTGLVVVVLCMCVWKSLSSCMCGWLGVWASWLSFI